MQAQTLPVLYTKSRQAMEVSTHTPFIAEIQTLLQNSEATDLKSAVEQLLRASGLLKGPIKDALKKRISEIPEVRSVLERLTALGLIIEDTGGQHVALTRLGESKTPIRLELKASAGNNIDMGSGVIGISGEAELALVATAQAPAVAATLGLPITASDVLHSCTLGGNVGIKGNIKAPMVNAEADAKASLGVTWHFQRSAEDTVLNSLVYSALDVGQGACPWDLEQVMRVLDEPRLGNGHLDALKAIDLRTERTVGFSAGIEVKRGFNREFEVAGAEGEQKIAATAAIGVNFGYSIRSRGLYDLRLIKQDGDVILRLDKSSETTSKRTFDLGAEVGISGVDALATGWINKLLPPPPVAMEEAIAKWSTPGTLLKAKLEAALIAYG